MSGKRKGAYSVLVFMLAVMVALVGCSKSNSTEPPKPSESQQNSAQPTNSDKPRENVKLSMAIVGNQDALDSVKMRLDKYLDKSLNITVDVTVTSGGEYWDKVTTMFAGGTPPDILQMSEPFQKFARQGVLLDLDPLIEASPTFNKPDFFKPALEFFQYDGKQYGIPGDLNTWVVFYNEDLFANAGLKTPWEYYQEGNWTWETYLELAKKLTIKEGNRYVQFGSTYPWINGWSYSAWVFSNGGTYLNEDMTKSTVTDPKTVAAFKYTTELANLYQVAPSDLIGGDLSGMSFQTGKIAMQTEGSWWIGGYKDSEFKWNIAPMPVANGSIDPLTSYTHNSGYSIAKASKYPQEAWAVLEALAKPESYADDAALRGVIPPRPSVVEDNPILDAPGMPSNAGVIAQMLEKGKLFQFSPTYAEENDVYWNVGQEILSKALTPEDGAAKIAEQVNAILAQNP